MGKFGKFFWGRLDLSWDIFGYTKQSEDLISNVVIFHAFWKFLRLGNSAWDFLGGFGEIPILIYAPIRSSQDPMHPSAPNPRPLWKFCNVEPRLDRENDLARLHFICALTVKSWMKSSYYNLKYVE